ncbi:MAG TPA: hypothetical protein VE861_07060 [Gemmatimonadaceae bacterium]|nr:hypothetical protein [Gemmatimonadaceae bacterium]
MPTPFESAQLNLQLFDMRREPVLRKARDWFISEFHPASAEEYFGLMAGEKNSWLRMVIGYWDMAASMVVQGAISQESFIGAHGEIIGVFAKLQPYLGDIRARVGNSAMANIEQVVMAMPDAEAEMAGRRARLKARWEALQGTKAGFIV